MLKKIIIPIFIYFLFLNIGITQSQVAKKHFFVSLNYKYASIWRRDTSTFDVAYVRRFQIRPSFGMFIKEKHAIGVFGEYDRNWSNVIEATKHYGVGLSYRLYRKNPFDWSIPKKRPRLFFDVTYFYGNYLYKKEELIHTVGLKYHTVAVGVGWAFRVYKGLFLGATYRLEMPIGGYPQRVRRMSITYHI